MARTNPLPRRLTLEAAQGGLSWKTILHKRDGYRSAFQKFDPATVAHFNTSEVEALLSDPGIVRNRPKLQSTMNNARRILEVQREFGTFDAYIWRFVARTWSMAAGKGCSGARRYSGNSTRIPLAIELGRGNRRLPVSLRSRSTMSLSVNLSIPQSVWLIIIISLVPSNRVERIKDRTPSSSITVPKFLTTSASASASASARCWLAGGPHK